MSALLARKNVASHVWVICLKHVEHSNNFQVWWTIHFLKHHLPKQNVIRLTIYHCKRGKGLKYESLYARPRAIHTSVQCWRGQWNCASMTNFFFLYGVHDLIVSKMQSISTPTILNKARFHQSGRRGAIAEHFVRRFKIPSIGLCLYSEQRYSERWIKHCKDMQIVFKLKRQGVYRKSIPWSTILDIVTGRILSKGGLNTTGTAIVQRYRADKLTRHL